MQRARCYLLGETAVVLELEPPITLASQKRIWRLTQRLVDMPNVVEAIPGMNNITVILREPQTLALDAIERLQRWWEESEALEPDSRSVEIPVIYGGAGGPDLAAVARHSGLSEKQVVELHASVEYVVWFLGLSARLSLSWEFTRTAPYAQTRRAAPAGSGRFCRHRRRADGDLSIIHAGRLAADRPHAVEVIRSDAGDPGSATPWR